MKALIGWGGAILALLAVIFGVYKMTSNPEQVVVAAANRESVSYEENVLGKSDAKIALIEYADFQCPACKIYSDAVKRLQADLGDDLILVYRHFPLKQSHEHAEQAAIYSEAAANQGMFWAYADMLYISQEAWTDQTDPTEMFLEIAQTLELDMEKFKVDVENPELALRVEADVESGYDAGVTGTPSFYVNGVKLPNPRNYEDLKRLVLSAAEK